LFDRPKPTAGCSDNGKRRLAYNFWNVESRLVISEVI
jgi:hypothetical protein